MMNVQPRHLALLLLVTLANLSSATADPTLVDVSASDPYASCASVEQAQSAGSAFEPQVAIDPRFSGSSPQRLVGVWQQDPVPAGSAGIVAGSSVDGGQTWHDSPLPFTRCAPNGLATEGSSDPWVSIGPDGAVYASALGLASAASGGLRFEGILVAVSHDGGQTWSDVQAIPDTVGTPEDKDSITADPTKSGVAYAVWGTSPRGASATTRAAFSETVDGGKTWSTPRIILHAARDVAAANDHQLLVDPRTHALHDIFFRLALKPPRTVCKTVKGRRQCHRVKPNPRSPGAYHYVVSIISSHDGGVHWSTAQNIGVAHFGNLGPPGRGHLGWPSAAVDPATGYLYAGWEEDRSGRISFTRSLDGGERWSKARSLQGGIMTLPAIAVDRKGNVGITYDTILTPQQGMATTVWFTVSHDHGAHFGQSVQIAGPSNLVPTGSFGTGGGHAAFLGDYEALAVGSAFYPFFVLPNGDSSFHMHVFASSIGS